jgi:alkyl hydroperoxide reductase subunit AhpC
MKELNVGDSAPDLPDMDEKKEFSALDVSIIGISPDPPKNHRKFIGKQDLKMNLLPVTRIYNKHHILLADN